ncbi:MAG: bifunctional 2-polyprenyl-6-hydroxyphenol methylase/3-demethylubiquinol 3-O-methyltransferase UbiG [Rickettsiales bacterium]
MTKEKNINNIAGSTVDTAEVDNFSRIADEWWDVSGKFAPLHKINPVRIEYIRDIILKYRDKNKSINDDSFKPLSEISLLDIGCGGGLIAEPMTRLGAAVTAIDASAKNISVASVHAQKMGLEIDYRNLTAEELVGTDEKFDVILALEILEHVADVPLFIKSCSALLKKDGIIICSTINRTVKSYALAIVAAEYILRMLPVGTHTWSKFIRPSELYADLEKNQLAVRDMAGMVFNPLSGNWRIDSKDLSVNYLITAVKQYSSL